MTALWKPGGRERRFPSRSTRPSWRPTRGSWRWLGWTSAARSSSTWLASVGIIIGIVFFGIPFALRHTNHAFARARQRNLDEFLHANVEIATGRLPGWEAYLQIMIIPVCLALAATVLGAIWVWES